MSEGRRLVRARHHRNVWDITDIDEEEVVVDRPQTNIPLVDLSQSPEPIMCSKVTTTLMPALPDHLPSSWPPVQRQPVAIVPYVPYTLGQDTRRCSILPAFPTSFYDDRPTLLLANVPVHKLNAEQLACREQGVYPLPYTMKKENFAIPSYFRQHYRSFMSSLVYQFNVDEAILDYNLCRFTECFRTFADDYIRRHKYSEEQFELNDKQKKYAFEFYLQIDGTHDHSGYVN